MAICYSNHRKLVQTLTTLLGNGQVPILFFSLQIYWSSSYIPHSELFTYAFVLLPPFLSSQILFMLFKILVHHMLAPSLLYQELQNCKI